MSLLARKVPFNKSQASLPSVRMLQYSIGWQKAELPCSVCPQYISFVRPASPLPIPPKKSPQGNLKFALFCFQYSFDFKTSRMSGKTEDRVLSSAISSVNVSFMSFNCRALRLAITSCLKGSRTSSKELNSLSTSSDVSGVNEGQLGSLIIFNC